VEGTISRRPTSTYRLQLRSGLTLRRVRALAEYFDELGVSDLYLSPILKASSDSPHGYSVVDFDDVDPRIGSIEELAELADELKARKMGVLLDVSFNHMSAAPVENAWWRDALELGPRSTFARFFDVDWNRPEPDLRGKVLLPVLAEPFDEALLKKKLKLVRTLDGLFVSYSKQSFPLSPATWGAVLGKASDEPEMRSILSALDALLEGEGPLSETAWKMKERLKDRAIALLHRVPHLGSLAEQSLARLSASLSGFRELLDRQAFRLSHHSEAGVRLNYRRFFDINDLVAVRQEDPEVFAKTHGFLFALMEQGWVSGLRIDHLDGLADPKDYLRKLPSDRYLVVEKILERDERLPPDWPIAGTTGYEFLNLLQRLFVDPSGEEKLTVFFRELTGENASYAEIVRRSKLEILDLSFRGELESLAEQLLPAIRQMATYASVSAEGVRLALRALVAGFPVYRTYLRPGQEEPAEADLRVFATAGAAARDIHPEEAGLVDAMVTVLTEGRSPDATRRFQQLTAAAMAKGVEDTAFYRYYPLVSLNEVGGAPNGNQDSLEEFHARNRERAARGDFGLTATSTHDNKREEDARSRIHALSEDPRRFQAAIERWRSWNRRHKKLLPRGEAPDASEEYLLYQTLIGTWPLTPLDPASQLEYLDRITAYMIKALREAKRNTSWSAPDGDRELAVSEFVSKLLDPRASREFLHDFASFEMETRRPGLLSSLSQMVLKCTAPGIPDFYQGTETWGFRLVDPDNRRPIDFGRRRDLLRRVIDQVGRDGESPFLEESMKSLEDGRLKVYLTWRVLRLRREREGLFLDGDYAPVGAEGRFQDHVIAFFRKLGGERVLVACSRFFTRLPNPPVGEAWEGTRLVLPADAEGGYHEVLSGRFLAATRALPLAELFRRAPFAVLVAEPRSS
jgi:(1->4)-alpha-D-glucan 1-alpha-D-glucosylmutase